MTGLVVVFTNLKGKKLGGFMSTGMVVCAGNADHTQVELMRPPEGRGDLSHFLGSVVGERIKVLGKEELFADEAQAVLNPKKKVWENVMPSLNSSDACVGRFKEYVLGTSKGPITCKTLKGASLS